MYPFLRLGLEIARNRRAEPLALGGVHVSRHTCLPTDLDMWGELNNGRALSLYDLGRIPLATRTGLLGALRRNGWGLTMAGVSVRYRRRVRAFERFEMRSQLAGRDARFFYIHQAMLRDGDAVSAALYRAAVTGPRGIIATGEVLQALGQPEWNPALPAWIDAWITAEALRPWPPEI